MKHGDGHDHVGKDSKGCDASEQSEDKTQSAEEFRRNGQKCKWRRNVHDAGEEAHGAGEAVSAEPPKHLLGAVREEDDSYHQSKNGCCSVVVGGNQFTNHKNSLRRKLAAPSRVQTPDKMNYPYIRILFVEISGPLSMRRLE